MGRLCLPVLSPSFISCTNRSSKPIFDRRTQSLEPNSLGGEKKQAISWQCVFWAFPMLMGKGSLSSIHFRPKKKTQRPMKRPTSPAAHCHSTSSDSRKMRVTSVTECSRRASIPARCFLPRISRQPHSTALGGKMVSRTSVLQMKKLLHHISSILRHIFSPNSNTI